MERLTVKELRALLETMPDDAVIVEECKGEHRRLRRRDISFSKYVVDADDGIAMSAGDRQPSDPDLAWLMACPGFVVLGAWS